MPNTELPVRRLSFTAYLRRGLVPSERHRPQDHRRVSSGRHCRELGAGPAKNMTHGDVVRMLEAVLQFPSCVKRLGLRGVVGSRSSCWRENVSAKEAECLGVILEAIKEAGTQVDLFAGGGRRARGSQL